MTEKDKRVLKYAIDNLIARENNLCEGFCKNNPAHRAERERDRDLIIFGIRDVLCEVERLEEQEKEMLEKDTSETVKQVNDWMIKSISNWMVESGTRSTTEGNWIIHVYEITRKFNVTKNWITAFRDEIVDTLYEHKAVADVLYDFFPDGDVESFDIEFYLSFCPSLSDED